VGRRRIVHATDFSPASAAAFQAAVAWARRRRAGLTLLHVLTPPAVVVEDSYLSAAAWRRLEADAERAARRRLDALAARARRAGVRASTLVLRGIPFEVIPRAAGRLRAELVVIGTRGRTGLGRLVLGSVAERVVGRSRPPVLTVPRRR
jgi:nucleotide-binding universal stress UspA family protein